MLLWTLFVKEGITITYIIVCKIVHIIFNDKLFLQIVDLRLRLGVFFVHTPFWHEYMWLSITKILRTLMDLNTIGLKLVISSGCFPNFNRRSQRRYLGLYYYFTPCCNERIRHLNSNTARNSPEMNINFDSNHEMIWAKMHWKYKSIFF